MLELEQTSSDYKFIILFSICFYMWPLVYLFIFSCPLSTRWVKSQPPYQPLNGLCVLTHFNHVQLVETLWTVAHQAPLSMGILQARILEWVAISSFRDLLNPGIEPRSPALAGKFFTTSTTWFIIWSKIVILLYSLLIAFMKHLTMLLDA